MDDQKTILAPASQTGAKILTHDHGDACGCDHDHHGHGHHHHHHGAQATVRRAGPKVGRNDPCLCGSGKKHKKCCGA